MQIAVTGGTGFLGAYICERLVEDGHELKALARETSDTSLLERLGAVIRTGDMADAVAQRELIEGCGCVVHAAVDFSLCREDPEGNFQKNLLGSLRWLDLCRQKAAQFIFISTCAVHEHILDDRPLDETHPLWPSSSYGAYKAAVEAFLPAYRDQHGVNGCALRPSGIYGVHRTKPERSHWYSLVSRVLDGHTVRVPTGGKVVHAADVAEAVARAVGNGEVAGEAFSLTDCHVYDQVVADFAAEIAGMDVPEAGPPGPGPKHQIVCDKARRVLGVDLDRGHAGIRAYVEELVPLIRG